MIELLLFIAFVSGAIFGAATTHLISTLDREPDAWADTKDDPLQDDPAMYRRVLEEIEIQDLPAYLRRQAE